MHQWIFWWLGDVFGRPIWAWSGLLHDLKGIKNIGKTRRMIAFLEIEWVLKTRHLDDKESNSVNALRPECSGACQEAQSLAKGRRHFCKRLSILLAANFLILQLHLISVRVWEDLFSFTKPAGRSCTGPQLTERLALSSILIDGTSCLELKRVVHGDGQAYIRKNHNRIFGIPILFATLAYVYNHNMRGSMLLLSMIQAWSD